MHPKVSIREEPLPFLVNEQLQSVFRRFPLETGAANAKIGEPIPAILLWTILNDSQVPIGNVWISQHTLYSAVPQNFINYAIYIGEQSQGAAKQSLPMVEAILPSRGITTLYAQVNSNKLDTGLRVRMWLVSEGFEIVRENITNFRREWDNERLVREFASPLRFQKALL